MLIQDFVPLFPNPGRFSKQLNFPEGTLVTIHLKAGPTQRLIADYVDCRANQLLTLGGIRWCLEDIRKLEITIPVKQFILGEG